MSNRQGPLGEAIIDCDCQASSIAVTNAVNSDPDPHSQSPDQDLHENEDNAQSLLTGPQNRLESETLTFVLSQA